MELFKIIKNGWANIWLSRIQKGKTRVELEKDHRYEIRWVWYHTILAGEVLLTNILLTAILVVLLSSCATHTVKTTEYTPVVQGRGLQPEELLLDVGVTIMDAGLDKFIKNDEDLFDKISKISNADLKDGGEGAFYIFLKQQKKLQNKFR